MKDVLTVISVLGVIGGLMAWTSCAWEAFKGTAWKGLLIFFLPLLGFVWAVRDIKKRKEFFWLWVGSFLAFLIPQLIMDQL